ncbi:Glutamine synthetase [Hondaea fermentalgiana]|uniref:Glutamine synthetase n=1 Tax=Hondaea fermentalgiana TaxID=2315210 RepID=A0A2R5GKL3_9STRA|nr:Glutamine synthetase [Hondaea fermentalgiana]|eukprot:GBG31165.1 Glutamine synthetase [Hondaea fermentalgiana]
MMRSTKTTQALLRSVRQAQATKPAWQKIGLRGLASKAAEEEARRGSLVFDVEKSAVADEWRQSLEEWRPMSKEAQNKLAEELVAFADKHGASYYAHWASPVRGPVSLTKHQTFMDYEFDGADRRLVRGLSGSKVFASEADGSSFPNGGLRQTHSAAAYLTWDRTSPPFIRGETLFLPSGFVSWKGDALDEKTPLLRSVDAIDRAGGHLLRQLGETEATGVLANLGCEQEFFLMDREHYLQRPDLMACGRTLLGASPARGQQTDLNYFAPLPARVAEVLDIAEKEMQKVGVTNTVYHSEVAPGQFEFAPLFTSLSVSADNNVVAMEILKEAAESKGLVALFHEKPFAGVNGSGKHSNWSLIERSTGRQLFVPGESPEEQRTFIALMACMVRAVHLHGDLIRTSVGSAGNDHRLGAQEAPPAILSLDVGETLAEHLQRIIDDPSAPIEGFALEKKEISFNTRSLQPVRGAGEDRNRTAPFPFCGNRFEFRAVGSNQHAGFPMTCVQAAFAESMMVMADQLAVGTPLETVVRHFLVQHGNAIFTGNGYSSEWQEEEAPRRGLLNLQTTVDALETLASEKNVKLFSKVGVFTPDEVQARQELYFERYVEDIMIEANCLLDMLEKGALPACAQDLQTYSYASGLQGNRASMYSHLRQAVDDLAAGILAMPRDAEIGVQARYAVETIKPLMLAARELSDQSERLVADGLWPYPSYQEMLFEVNSMPRSA